MLIRGPHPGLSAGRWLGVAAIATAMVITLASGCGAKDPGTPVGAPKTSVITSTTKIASAGVLGNQRRPDESCAPDPAPVDRGQSRAVRHAAGSTDVRSDPQRIVVLSGDQLDTMCALGLQSRVVAAALPDGTPGHPGTQPSYLGTVIHNLAPAGTRTAPDMDAIRAASPDLILGSQELTPDAYPALSAIAPTVFTGAPGAGWRDNLRTVAAATGRADAAYGLLDGFSDAAHRAGRDNDAAHFQASVVQLTEKTLRVYGADTFPGSVLAEVGLDRPAAQRFTDKPYIEISATDLTNADFSIADGDIVYLSFSSPAAKDRAPAFLDSDAWRKLSANRDNRVFAVNNEVWQTGEGIVAARGMIDDLRWVNAPIN